MTAADVGDREAGARLVADTQDATDDAVSIADVDQGDTGATAAASAAVKGIKLEVVKRPEAKAGLRASARGYGFSRDPLPGPTDAAGWPRLPNATP
jgi:hypothetical protein